MTDYLTPLLDQSAALHHHLCPRQVLGVRMGILAGKLLALELPQTNKRLLTIVETDGCFTDGVSVATNCWVGRRTLRVEDLGKVAATFVDTRTETAVRLFPSPQARQLAPAYAPEARNRWEGYLLGYQRLPDEELFLFQPVQLNVPISQLISRAGARVLCDRCGEEIINERQVVQGTKLLCRACVGGGYYAAVEGSQTQTAVLLPADLI
ncbi:MAG: formylmethanofuran dehydrogenase [Anaerolineae bacterium]|nr:formylmethanofuran dehydrogenase [Anaerolineae bacterium]